MQISQAPQPAQLAAVPADVLLQLRLLRLPHGQFGAGAGNGSHAQLASEFGVERVDVRLQSVDLFRVLGISVQCPRQGQVGIAQEYAAQDTLDEFIITNLPQSARLQEVQQSIASCNARIAQLQAATGTIPPSFFLPAAADGKPYQFQLRCRGTLGDVMLTMPLVFLHRFQDVRVARERQFIEMVAEIGRASCRERV